MKYVEVEKNIGRRVKFTPFENCDADLIQYGVIASVDGPFIFVRFDNDLYPKAVRAFQLEIISSVIDKGDSNE